MKNLFKTLPLILSAIVILSFAGCSSDSDSATKLQTENVDDVDPAAEKPENDSNENTDTDDDELEKAIEEINSKNSAATVINETGVGDTINYSDMSSLDNDPTGLHITEDYDGDGIPNASEIVTNPYVADYPRIVTRISPPIIMELQPTTTTEVDSFSETIDENSVESITKKSMEDRQYTSTNYKTTPYEVENSSSFEESHAEGSMTERSKNSSKNSSVSLPGLFAGASGGGGSSGSSSGYTNIDSHNVSDSVARAEMSRKMVFEDVTYVDNLSRSGVTMTEDSISSMTNKSRNSDTIKKSSVLGDRDGVVKATLHLENPSLDVPVKISNVTCTLSFRTPAGKFLPVQTFKLRNEDWTEFEQEIYGGEALSPFVIEISDLKTSSVADALENGYMPQVHIVSYDITRVKDSNYNPGVDNLKIVKENCKGRTAQILISAPELREEYRVAAFDINDDGSFTPGISLKKALFNIFRSRMGAGEKWGVTDSKGNPLTVADRDLKWKKEATDPNNYVFDNTDGNSWRDFETMVKTYTDDNDVEHHREQIKSIMGISQYNPFDKDLLADNSPLPLEEVYKMRYWYVLHNGRYFEGDINDPICPGERYEIVLIDVRDSNEHFKSFSFTPFQAQSDVFLHTVWNQIINKGDYARSVMLGKVYKDDIINLKVHLMEDRQLFNLVSNKGESLDLDGTNMGSRTSESELTLGNNLKYTLEEANAKRLNNGIPGDFTITGYGSVNSLQIETGLSANADYYEYEIEYPDGKTYTVNVDCEDVEKQYGIVNINSMTKDSSGELLPKLSRGVYTINARAYGKLYGVALFTPCASKNVQVDVNRAASAPVRASFSKASSTGKLYLSIQNPNNYNAEYYKVDIEGPLNPSHLEKTGDSDLRTEYIMAGVSCIDIDTPVNYIKNTGGEPGVYKVTVTSVNGYNSYSSVSAEPEYVEVPLEKYSEQKKYIPAITGGYAMSDAVDLEVNFDDGSGWYRLLLAGQPQPGIRYIDCRYTTSINLKDQVFNIRFQPPAGRERDMGHNVFVGDAKKPVNVYIRTVALAEYRDRFWPKLGADLKARFYNFVQDGTSLIDMWVHGSDDKGTDQTDITNMELAVTSKRYLDYIEDEKPFSFTINRKVSGTEQIEELFFSPLKYRAYTVHPFLTGGELTTDASIATPVTFDAEVPAGENRTIRLSNFQSDTSDKFYVYYRALPISDYNFSSLIYEKVVPNAYQNIPQNENVLNWVNFAGSEDAYYFTSVDEVKITGLTPNQAYLVAVVGQNSYKTYSVPQYAMNSSDNYLCFYPRDSTKPEKVKNVSFSLKPGGSKIIVSNLISDNATGFQISYKCVDGTDGNGTETVDVTQAGVPVEVVLPTKMWNTYEISVRAINDFAPTDAKYSDASIYQFSSYNDFEVPDMFVDIGRDDDTLIPPEASCSASGTLSSSISIVSDIMLFRFYDLKSSIAKITIDGSVTFGSNEYTLNRSKNVSSIEHEVIVFNGDKICGTSRRTWVCEGHESGGISIEDNKVTPTTLAPVFKGEIIFTNTDGTEMTVPFCHFDKNYNYN